MRQHFEGVALRWVALLTILATALALSPGEVEAAVSPGSATEILVVEGSVSNCTLYNTIIKQDPAVLAAMTKTFADQLAVSAEAIGGRLWGIGSYSHA